MRFVLSGAAACVLTAVRFPVPLRRSALWSCSLALLCGAGYRLAAFGGSLRENFQAGALPLLLHAAADGGVGGSGAVGQRWCDSVPARRQRR